MRIVGYAIKTKDGYLVSSLGNCTQNIADAMMTDSYEQMVGFAKTLFEATEVVAVGMTMQEVKLGTRH